MIKSIIKNIIQQSFNIFIFYKINNFSETLFPTSSTPSPSSTSHVFFWLKNKYYLWSSHCFLIQSRSVWILASFSFISIASIVFLNSSNALILLFNVARTTQSPKINETIEMIVCGCDIRVWMSMICFFII